CTSCDTQTKALLRVRSWCACIAIVRDAFCHHGPPPPKAIEVTCHHPATNSRAFKRSYQEVKGFGAYEAEKAKRWHYKDRLGKEIGAKFMPCQQHLAVARAQCAPGCCAR